MAFQFDPNETPLDGAEAVSLLVAVLVAAGWSIHAYGTGSGLGGARVSGGAGFGAASLRDLANSWVAVVAGGATDTLTFRRNNAAAGNNTTWTIGYAKGGLLANGAGGTVDSEATAGDLQVIYGPGALFPADNAGGMCRVSCGADDASAVFYITGWAISSGTPLFLFFCDVLSGLKVADTAPMVFYAAAGSNPGHEVSVGNPSQAPQAWYRYGLSGHAWGRVYYAKLAGWPGFVQSGCVPSGYDAADALFVPMCFFTVSGVQPKGVSTLLAWNGTARATGYTFDPTGAGDDRVSVGELSVPWPAGVAAVI